MWLSEIILGGVKKELIRLGGRIESSSSLSVRSMTCDTGRFVLVLLLGTEAEPSREGAAIGEDDGVASTLSFDSLPPETSTISTPFSQSLSAAGVVVDSAATDQRPSTSIVTESTDFGVLFKISRKYLEGHFNTPKTAGSGSI